MGIKIIKMWQNYTNQQKKIYTFVPTILWIRVLLSNIRLQWKPLPAQNGVSRQK
jgi:hypothetical protein